MQRAPDLCPQDLRKLWLIWDSSKYPSYHYIQKLPVSRVHLYTFVQAMFLDAGRGPQLSVRSKGFHDMRRLRPMTKQQRAPLLESFSSCKASSSEVIGCWAAPNLRSKPQSACLQFICLAILYGLKEIKDPPDARVPGDVFGVWNQTSMPGDCRGLPLLHGIPGHHPQGAVGIVR